MVSVVSCQAGGREHLLSREKFVGASSFEALSSIFSCCVVSADSFNDLFCDISCLVFTLLVYSAQFLLAWVIFSVLCNFATSDKLCWVCLLYRNGKWYLEVWRHYRMSGSCFCNMAYIKCDVCNCDIMELAVYCFTFTCWHVSCNVRWVPSVE